MNQHYNTISQHYNTISQHYNTISQHYKRDRKKGDKKKLSGMVSVGLQLRLNPETAQVSSLNPDESALQHY